jgi:hypothetical protein
MNNMIADADYACINGDIILFSGHVIAENDCPVKMTAENDCPIKMTVKNDCLESFRREGDFFE